MKYENAARDYNLIGNFAVAVLNLNDAFSVCVLFVVGKAFFFRIYIVLYPKQSSVCVCASQTNTKTNLWPTLKYHESADFVNRNLRSRMRVFRNRKQGENKNPTKPRPI